MLRLRQSAPRNARAEGKLESWQSDLLALPDMPLYRERLQSFAERIPTSN
jgi:hypothetical protein